MTDNNDDKDIRDPVLKQIRNNRVDKSVSTLKEFEKKIREI